MKKLLFVIIVLLNVVSTNAQPRSELEAKQIASDFFAKSAKKKAPKLSVVSQQKVKRQIRKKVPSVQETDAQEQAFYVVNDEANNRFVMVSSDKRLKEILGYSDHSLLDADDVPEGLSFMMDSYNREYKEILTSNISGSVTYKRISKKVISPLIQTKWNQNVPYNDFCPIDPFGYFSSNYGGKCCTGCVATAMAQVMNFHQYPNSGKGQVAYSTGRYKISQSMDFSNVIFDWGNMSNIYNSSNSSTQNKAVAQLMHACGVASLMDYGSPVNSNYDKNDYNGSGAYTLDMAYALINYFGYNPNLKYYLRKYFSAEEWDSIIVENLDRGLPIVYAGNNGKSGGHEFLLTGYNGNDYYWFNWGWGGKYDGYFRLSALTPGTTSNYSLNQEMVCYISPETISKYEDGIFASEFVLDGERSDQYIYCYFTDLRWINAKVNTLNSTKYYEASTYNGKLCVGLFDLNFNFIKNLSYKDMNWRGGTYYSTLNMASIKNDPKLFKEGSQFYIAPYSSSSEASLSFIRTINGKTNYYLAKVVNGKLSLIPRGVPDIEPLPILRPLEGTYDVSAISFSNSVINWDLSLVKDGTDSTKYWFINLDPAASSNGCKNSDNKAYGYLDNMGNIKIPTGQSLGDMLTINNYSSIDSIKVYVSSKDSIMTIEDVWGLVSPGNPERKTLSQWSSTTFRYKAPEKGLVESPVIVVNDKNQMTLSCSTVGADIYYTFSSEGKAPSTSSSYYTSSVQLNENGVIKAVAVKNGKYSAVAMEEVTSFVVDAPAISSPNSDNKISITCSTDNATIYYTTNGDTPSASQGIRYSGPFSMSESTTIKAIAVRPNWRPSEVSEYAHVAITEFTILDNAAGDLPNRLTDSNKLITTKLTITGKLNGTDIKFIRDMLQECNLAYLDIQGADIVSGGEAYYYSGSKAIYTENNYVDDYMFWRMVSLKNLVLPNSTRRIGGIRGCDNLTELIVPEGCESVGSISGLKMEYIHIPKSVSSIRILWGGIGPCFKAFNVDPENPFFKSVAGVLFNKEQTVLLKYPESNKTDYSIPNGVEQINDYAFENSTITSVVIPSTVIKLGDSSFKNCAKLERATIPNSVQVIGRDAFNGCVNLKKAILPDGLEKLESGVFVDCQSLQTITLGANLSELSSSAFGRNTALQSIDVANENTSFTSLDGVLFSKDMKTLIRYPIAKYADLYLMPEGVEIIGDAAFSGCVNLKNLILPNSLLVIGSSSFNKCSVQSLNIPESVKSIRYAAFSECPYLESLTLPSKLEYLGAYAITNCAKLRFVYLPESIETLLYGNISDCPSLEVVNSDIKDVNSIIVNPVVNEGIITYYACGLFDDPNSMWMNLIDLTEPFPHCKWLVPYGCSVNYLNSSWWRSEYTIEEKTQNGDSNNDGEVSVSDIVEMVDYVLNRPSARFSFYSSDLNKDGEVDVTDITLLVSLVMVANRSSRVDVGVNGDRLFVSRTEKGINIELENKDLYTAFQFDIVTSPGQTINDISLNKSRCPNHYLYCRQIADNRWRLVAFSLLKESYLGESGDLLNVKLNDTRNHVQLDNISFVTMDNNVFALNFAEKSSTGVDVLNNKYFNEIYSGNGMSLGRGPRAMQGLKKGVFIVNGKKIVVK